MVKQADISIDYIWQELNNNIIDEEDTDKIIRIIGQIIDSSYQLRSKKELIEDFIFLQLSQKDRNEKNIMNCFLNMWNKNVMKKLWK